MSGPWLVTGASGFLGGHVTEALVEREIPVRVLVRETSDTTVLDPLPVEKAIASLEDRDGVRQAMEGVERVIHCGGFAADWGPLEWFEAANVDGVRNVTDAALEAGVARVVHVSSTDVYGYPDEPVDETAELVERGWPYGDTKIAGERVARRAADRGLPLVVVRPATVWGPRSIPFVVELVDLMKQRVMLHIGGGKTDAGLCYVRNAADALILAAQHEAAVGRTYNLHDGTGMTWKTYISMLAIAADVPEPWLDLPRRPTYAVGWLMEKLWGAVGARERPLLTRVAVELLGTTQGFDTTRIRSELGWIPAIDPEEGMNRVHAWLQEL